MQDITQATDLAKALEWLDWIKAISTDPLFRAHATVLKDAILNPRLEGPTTELLADAECAKVVDIAVSSKTLHLGAVRVVASEQVPPHQAYIRCLNRTIGVITNLGGEA